jgi:hypothetical protein
LYYRKIFVNVFLKPELLSWVDFMIRMDLRSVIKGEGDREKSPGIKDVVDV